MKKIKPYQILLTLVAASIFVVSTAAQDAHTAPDLVRRTRALKVSSLERRMPPVALDAWLDKTLGKHPSVTWIAEDCVGGKANFDVIDHDHRLCVVAEGAIAENLFAIISIEYSKLVNHKPAAPRLERITVGLAGTRYGDQPGALSDLPNLVAKIRRAVTFVDPSEGQFYLSDLKEYDGIQSMIVDTDRSSRGRFPNVWRRAVLSANSTEYPTLHNYYDGKRWSFTTVTVKGIHYKFDGKFEKTLFREYGETVDENILKGHLTRFVRGKIATEADLTFSFDLFRDAP